MDKRTIGYFLFLCLGLGLTSPNSVQAADITEIQQQQTEIQAKQDQLNTQLNTQMAQVSEQTVKTNKLQTDIQTTQKLMRQTKQSLKTQKKLLKTRKSYAAKRLTTLQRQNNDQNMMTLIASANSLTDMLQRIYAVKAIQKADDLAIKNVQTTYDGLKSVRQNLSTQQKKLATQQAQLTVQNESMTQSMATLKQTIATNEQQLADLTQQKNAAQQAAQDAEAAAKQATPQTPTEDEPEATPTQVAPKTTDQSIFNNAGLTPSSNNASVATGVKISFYDPAVLGSSMGYTGVAANLAVYPKNTRLKIVFADGTEIHRVVNDTGTFVYSNPNQIDVAWPNAAIPSYGVTTATVTVE